MKEGVNMLLELKAELEFAKKYCCDNLENKEMESIITDTFNHAINLIKVLKDRQEIADAKVSYGNKIEQRSWKEVSEEYKAISDLERLYNGR